VVHGISRGLIRLNAELRVDAGIDERDEMNRATSGGADRAVSVSDLGQDLAGLVTEHSHEFELGEDAIVGSHIVAISE
jgi:hypothetical protein